jgi:hypothetical protein
MLPALLAVVLLFSFAYAEFRLERADVAISNINKDGSVKITENIKIIAAGTYEQEKYKAGINNNDLSTWAALTGLADVKMHVNPALVNIRDFTLRPQTLKRCDPLLDICHGELIMTYSAYPYFNKTSGEQTKGTGIFTIDAYKPRTTKYTLNVNSLSFRSTQPAAKNTSSESPTSENFVILDRNVYLKIIFPSNTLILDLSQTPENMDIRIPTASVSELEWTNTVLGQFSLVFEVEESLDKEVVEFFSSIPKKLQDVLFGVQGMAIVAIIAILLASYIYLKSMEKKG